MTRRLVLTGDVMTGRGIDQVLPHPGAPRLLESWVRDAREYVRLAEQAHGPIPVPVPPAYVWGDALAEMDRFGPALRIVNLETAVTRSEAAWPGKGIHYRMDPRNVDCLTAARLDGCSLANNHVLDWGRAGLEETLSTLAEAGLASAGAGLDLQQASAPAALPWADGGRVLLSAWATPSSGVPEGWAAGRDRPGVALLPELTERSAAAVARTVERVRQPGDVAVVSLHWGGNWGFELPPAHRTFARRLIDLGAADVVHGHSSHHALPIEVYRGRAILYGCGDLLNDYEGIGPHGSLRSDLACLYLLSLAADGRLQALEIAPLQLRRFRLEQADPQARDWLERVFLEQGRPLGTRVETTSQGRFALRWD
jgi:poly-gamma-glutamate capsule biosynthesis protein CapA/YwtB (metallophosphatase superfamily)